MKRAFRHESGVAAQAEGECIDRLGRAPAGRPVRVLLTVPRLASTSGPYREMMAIAKYLPRGEFELTVCSLRRRGYRETSPRLFDLGVDCFVSEYRPKGDSWSYFKNVPASLRAQREIDRRGPFDVQHSLDFSSLPFEAFLARRKSRFYVFNQGTMNEYGRRAMLRLKVLLSNRVIAISDSVMRLLQELGASSAKLRKVSLGIDLEDLPEGRLGAAQDGLWDVLSVGQIIPRKRHEDAIRALARVSAALPRLKLRIAGGVVDETYYRGLQNLVSELGLSGRVEFLGLRSDVPQLMLSSAALIHCADSEAFGWVLVEAMAEGVPVIAANVDGPKEILEDGRAGILVAAGDVAGFAEALLRVVGDRATAREFAEKGRRRVETLYSARAMAERIADVYRELVSEKAAASD